jgi:hypothetical protein
MSIAALLLAAAAPAQAPAEIVLGCRLTTPAGDEIAFSARLGSPLAVLEPVPGTAWPTQRVIGPGGWRQKKGLEAEYHFAGTPSGIDLKVEDERATLFVGKRLRSGPPRAHGFCLSLADPAAVRRDAPVSAGAGAAIPAFDSQRWPQSGCGLVTRSGRRAVIDYNILGSGTQSEIRTADLQLMSSGRAVVPRVQGFGRSGSRFGGKEGPSGAERLVVDEKAGEAVQLIDFERIGDGSVEPASAICGHTGIVKRPSK